MKILFLGAPGAGKGTLAARLSRKLNIPHISTGDMLRRETQSGSALGQEVQAVMDRGDYVNDELMLKIVLNRIALEDCAKGFILDGFPRTLPQAEALDEAGVHLDRVIVLDVRDEVVVNRLTGRRVHLASGRVYHVTNHPPKHEGLDDETGEPLVQRDDDQAETVTKRLTVYQSLTTPLLAYYEDRAIHINGEGDVASVEADICAHLEQ